MIKKIFIYIFGIAVFLIGQEVSEPTREIQVHKEGTITYISGTSYYTDLGKNSGAAIGDSLEIKRKTDLIGFIRITNLSRKSSIGSAIWAKNPFQIGDRVILDKTIVEVLEESKPETAIIDTSPQILEETAKEPIILKSTKPEFKLNQRGKIALRITYFGNKLSGEQLNWNNRTIGTLNYSLSSKLPFPISVAVYGRSASDPTNNEFTYSIYHLELGFDSPQGKYSAHLGRIYASNLSGIGMVDGMMISYKLNKIYSLGTVVGSQPDLKTNKFSGENVRMGAYLRWNNRLKLIRISGNIAGIGQYRNSNVDREFLYLQNHLSVSRWVSLFLSGELDFDRKDLSVIKDYAELTSLNGTIRIRPFRWLSLSSRYSGSKNVKYFASQTSIPDSLFNNQLRTGFFNSIRLTILRNHSIQIGQSYRSQTGARKGSQLYSISITSRNITSMNFMLRGGFSILDNEQIRALRSRIATSTTLMNTINLYVEYELYQYRYGGIGDPNNRHSISADAAINFSKHYYLSILVEKSWESDLNYYDVFSEISYRF